jgi:hypothetical protein
MWPFRLFDTLWAVLPVALVFVAIRPLSARELRQFVGRYGVVVDDETGPTLKQGILRARVIRLILAAIGLSIHPLLSAVDVGVPHLGALLGLSGYLLGQLAATTLSPPGPSTVRRASLIPRHASDYFSRHLLLTPAVALVVSAVALTVYAVEPRAARPSETGYPLSIVAVAVAAVVMYGAVWFVVRRPQCVTSPALVAVDDALRAQSIHGIAATALAVSLVGTGSCLLEAFGAAQAPWLHVVGSIAAVATLVGGRGAWAYRTAPWHVTRTVSA